MALGGNAVSEFEELEELEERGDDPDEALDDDLVDRAGRRGDVGSEQIAVVPLAWPARPARPAVLQKSRTLTRSPWPRQVSGTRTVLVGRFMPWDRVLVAHRTRSAPLR